MAPAPTSAAFTGRESASTRNPHSAFQKTLNARALQKLSPEERVAAQWKAAFGCPISDEAKVQFCVNAVGHTFRLSDVRLWQASQKDPNDKCLVYLEFFFDGSPSDIDGKQDEFNRAFEGMIEQQLQERRIVEFRQKLTARRRGTGGSEGPDEGTGADDDWRRYLKTPVPKTELSIRSIREAGCCLSFLVCQTSLSISASEVLGQIAFQEHFPIDGVEQEPSKSTKPLPRWVYILGVCTVGMTTLTVFAWWQVVHQVVLATQGATDGSSNPLTDGIVAVS